MFDLGRIMITKNVHFRMIRESDFLEFLTVCISRYRKCDFGEISVFDVRTNIEHIESNTKDVVAYYYGNKVDLLIKTNLDYKITMISIAE